MNTDDVLDMIDAGIQRIVVTVKTAVTKTWNNVDPEKAELKSASSGLRSDAARLVNHELKALRARITDLISFDDPCHRRLTDLTHAMIRYKRDSLVLAVFRYMKYNLEGYVPRGDTPDIVDHVVKQNEPAEFRRTIQLLSCLQ